MKTLLTCCTALLTIALVAGCNGASSGSTDGGGGDNGRTTSNGTPDPNSIEAIRNALGLTQDPVDIEDAMEQIDDLIYEEAWEAESEDRLADAVQPLLKAQHLFLVSEPEKEEHKTDERFQKWMKAAAQYCADGAEAAHRKDRKALQAAFAKLDESCETCHKPYRTKKDR